VGSEIRRDVARQAANVVGAIFHVVAGLFLADGAFPDENITLIQPSNLAFVIWAPIFLSLLAYAAYQALPSKRESPLLRRIGWFTAAAFFLNGVLEILSSPDNFAITEALLLVMLLFLAVAYLRLMRSAEDAMGVGDRWLVALPVALFFGWITAANVVGAAQVLGYFGLPSGGLADALVGAAPLLAGGCVVSAALLAGKAGPLQGSLTYAAAVLWALLGVVANQYDASLLTTGAALLSAALIGLVLLDVFRGGRRTHRGAGHVAGSGTA
jgi:hypothetical protein